MFSRLFQLIKQRRTRKDLYATSDFWDSKADYFSDTAVSMWPNKNLNRFYDREQKNEISFLGDNFFQRQNILDLGCGTGRFSRWFAQQGANVTGIDFSKNSLKIAERLSENDNITYCHGSMFSLPYKANYDFVFSLAAMTVACQDKEQLLNVLFEVKKILRPEGVLLLLEPIHKGFLHRVLEMDIAEFMQVMDEAGFQVERKAPLHFWPMRLLLAYISWPHLITFSLYHLGQALMKLPKLNMLGDYWLIMAKPVQSENKD